MALTVADLFNPLKEIISDVIALDALQDGVAAAKTTVQDSLGTQNLEHLIGACDPAYNSVSTGYLNGITALGGLARTLLQDKELVIDPLALTNNGIQDVLRAIYDDLVDQSEDVLESTVTLGSITETSSGTDTGSLIRSAVLDGFNNPHPGLPSHIGYAGVTSELAMASESIVLECTADSEASGSAEGQETFRFKGSQSNGYYRYYPEGWVLVLHFLQVTFLRLSLMGTWKLSRVTYPMVGRRILVRLVLIS